MTTQYEFDFSKLTWDDLDKLPKGGLTALAIVDRLCVGGIRELSLSEVADVLMPQFVKAYSEWMKNGRIGDVMPNPDTSPRFGNAIVSFSSDGVTWSRFGVTECSLTIGGDDNESDDDDPDDEELRGMLDGIKGLE